jgi:hypothetical protein
MDERYYRNLEVDDLLETWEWCSRHRHTKWLRKRKLRNGCFIGLAYALSDGEKDSITPSQLLKNYRSLSRPILDRDGVVTFWEARPMSLLELSLGSYTKASPLTKSLNRLRLAHQDNPTLDELAKKMRGREERFGDDWFTDGHHPQREVRLLKKEMQPLCNQLRDLMADENEVVSKLALEVLAKGWQFGEIPVSSRVRKTPEKVLNRATRLKLWQAGQEILSRNLDEEEMIRALWDGLHRKVTPAVKAAIEAQGHTVADVVGDLMSFDLQKSCAEITS